MPTLTYFKYTPERHAKDFERLALYFNRMWQWAKPQKRDHAIPLSRLNRTLTLKRNQPLVKMVANIWFEQKSRGNNIPGKASCSVWERRASPKITKQMMRALKDLNDANVAVVEEMWQIASEKNSVEVSLKTSVKFPTIEAAELFHAQVEAMLNAEPEEPSMPVDRSRHAALSEALAEF